MSNLAVKTNDYLSFCQRRYDRSMSKADLMDGLAQIARENGEMEVASILCEGAKKLRSQVMEAAKIVTKRHENIGV